MRASRTTSVPTLNVPRFILRADGVVVLIAGIALTIGARPISRALGVDHALILALLGIACLPYGLLLVVCPVHRRAMLLPAIGNTAWVAISLLMLVIDKPAFSGTGRWIVGATAIVVALFAVGEFAAAQHTHTAD